MRKTRFWAAIAAGALILAGIAGWVYPSHRPLEAKASTSIEAKVDPFSLMSTAKDLPAEEFEDFSLVFSSPVPKPINHENGVVLVSLVNLSRVSFSSGGGPPFGTGSATMSLSSLPFAMTVPPTTWEVATSPCPTMSSVKARIGIVVSRRHLGWRTAAARAAQAATRR